MAKKTVWPIRDECFRCGKGGKPAATVKYSSDFYHGEVKICRNCHKHLMKMGKEQMKAKSPGWGLPDDDKTVENPG